MLKYINLVMLAGMIVMNYLANALPLNNKTTGELSDSLPNLFVPAGITFSIWGVIYLLIILFNVIQFFPVNKEITGKIGWLFAVSCLLNSVWIVAWHYQKIPLSLVIMTGLLITLILINQNIRDFPFSLVKATFGIYLGWICIATIANVTALFVRYSWNGFGVPEEIWTIVMISAGTIIVALTVFRLLNPFIGLSVIWAFAGIIIKRQDDYRSIVIVAVIAIIIVTLATILGFIKKNLV